MLGLYSELKKYIVDDNIDFRFIKGKIEEYIVFYSDAEKINQIFFNLLSNAFKFTKNGKIEFGYEKKEKEILFF